MASNKIRIALRESVTRQKLDSAAWDNNWDFDQIIQRSETRPFEKIWLTPDEQTAIHYIEDFLLGINYLLIQGAEADQVAQQARATIETYSNADIRQMAQQAKGRDDNIRAVYYAAIAAPLQYDESFFKIFQQAFAHENPDVRSAGVVASGYVEWPEFREPLEKLQQSDPDETVREDARVMLEG